MIDGDGLREVRERLIERIGVDPESISEIFETRGIDEGGIVATAREVAGKFMMLATIAGESQQRSHEAVALWGIVYGLELADELAVRELSEALDNGGDV